jgi:hypothetical protein
MLNNTACTLFHDISRLTITRKAESIPSSGHSYYRLYLLSYSSYIAIVKCAFIFACSYQLQASFRFCVPFATSQKRFEAADNPHGRTSAYLSSYRVYVSKLIVRSTPISNLTFRLFAGVTGLSEMQSDGRSACRSSRNWKIRPAGLTLLHSFTSLIIPTNDHIRNASIL